MRNDPCERELTIRRLLMGGARRDYYELRHNPPPLPEHHLHREQRRRLRERIKRARLGIIPWRPSRWLGRKLTRNEQMEFAAALQWFIDARQMARVGAGRLTEIRLLGLVDVSEFKPRGEQ
jgi:hypothetical protein